MVDSHTHSRDEPLRAPAVAGLVALTGLGLVLAFPPVGWRWVGWFALAPLGLAAARCRRGRQLLLVSWAVFAVWWAWQARWMMPLGLPSWLGVVFVESLAFALGAWGIKHLRHGLKMPMVAALPLGWTAMDLLRSWLPFGGFNWFSLGHSQAPAWAEQRAGYVVQTADLFGEHTPGLLLAMTAGLIVDAALAPRRERTRLTRAAVLWAVLVAGAIGYGAWRVGQTDRVTTPGPVIAVVQSNRPLNNRDDRPYEEVLAEIEADFVRMLTLTRGLAGATPRPAVVVWPESSVPEALNTESLPHRDGRFIADLLSQVARDARFELLVGGSSRFDWEPRAFPDGSTYYLWTRNRNSVYRFDPNGKLADERYDKIHLVPFGEYIPGSHTLPWIKSAVLKYFSPWEHDHTVEPGSARRVFKLWVPSEDGRDWATLHAVTPICFEDTVGRVCRRLVYQDGQKAAQVLINLTNGGWYNVPRADGSYASTTQNRQHLQVATLRSIENRVPTARAVNTGISGFIDSTGRITAVVEVDGNPQLVDGVSVQAVKLDPRRPVYARVGDGPVWLLTAVSLVLLGVALVRRRPVSR